VFGVSFEEIAETIGREPAACRQLAARARTHVRAARPRFAGSRRSLVRCSARRATGHRWGR
jgi:RNA polymerase sigma-70 factor (ECF subfamily)